MSFQHAFKETLYKKFPQGDFYRASSKNFPALTGLAIQAVDIAPGAVREPHSHPNANQLDFCVSGQACVGIVGPDGATSYLDLNPGDISFVPLGHLHWIENRGTERLNMLIVLSHEEPLTIEMSDMLSGVPNATLANLYDVPVAVFDAIPDRRGIVIGGGNKEVARPRLIAAE